MGVFALGYDRDMTPAPGVMMLEGFPDMECTIDPAAIRDGWEEGIGVVVEGTMTHAGIFESSRLMVKHSNEYKAPQEGETVEELYKTVESL